MKNYVISLTTASERRAHIAQELGKQSIPFNFFDAITPTQVKDLATKFQINIDNANLTQGELACLFSHICLWQKAIDENLDYIAIFEDDIYLGECADKFLLNSDWIPSECGLIKLEMFDKYAKMSLTPLLKYENRVLRQLKEIHLGAAGYILSKEMCLFLMDFSKNYPQGIVASDHILFEDCLKSRQDIYQLVPALCAQSDRIKIHNVFSSSLEKDRRVRLNSATHISKQKKSLTVTGKIHRELKRIYHQTSTLTRKIYLVLFCNISLK